MKPFPPRRKIAVAWILGALMFVLQACATGGSEVFLQSVEKDVEQGRAWLQQIVVAVTARLTVA